MTDRIEGRLVALEATPDAGFLDAMERAWELGDAVLPIDPGLPPGARHELETVLGAGQPITAGVALVVATSGTEGPPKGAELTHDALRFSAEASLARLGATPDQRWLCCLPLHHIAGLQVVLRARLARHRPILHPGFDIARITDEHEATHVSLVPTMLHRLLEAGADLRRFEAVLLGGAAAPTGLVERARELGVNVVQTYGMTETCGGCVYDGIALDGVGIRVVDDVVEIAGPVLFRGYRNDPARTATVLRDGWFRTSDLGELGSDGRLRVLGRADDVIVSGGEKIPAAALEALLAEHPGVGEAAVTGRQDAEWGQRVIAYVVPAEEVPVPDLAELRAFVAARAPAPWAPREVVVVDALPRTALGKLIRPRTSPT